MPKRHPSGKLPAPAPPPDGDAAPRAVPGSLAATPPDDPDPAYRLAHAAQLRARRKRLKTPANGSRPPRQEALRSPSQRAGQAAEDRALAYLQRAGLLLLARNVSCRAGEIDLIMRDGPVLAFIEVRARKGDSHGGAAASVGPGKQRRITRAARHFLHTRWRGPLPPCRFDVVAFEQQQDAPRWIRAAFDAGEAG